MCSSSSAVARRLPSLDHSDKRRGHRRGSRWEGWRDDESKTKCALLMKTTWWRRGGGAKLVAEGKGLLSAPRRSSYRGTKDRPDVSTRGCGCPPSGPGPAPSRCVWSPLDASPGTRDKGSLWARSICPGELYTHYATDSDRYASIGSWRVAVVNGVLACCEDYYSSVEVCKIENLHGIIVLLHLRELYFSLFSSNLGNVGK